MIRLGVAKTIMAFCMLFIALAPAFSVQPDEVLDDPELESRARLISAELRCLVCQNQSIDDSDADLARDLRVLVRKRLLNGDTNKQVIDYVVSRYGDFVLLKPSFTLKNLLLWITPVIVLLIGVILLFRKSGKRDDETVNTPLSEKEKNQLKQLLDD